MHACARSGRLLTAKPFAPVQASAPVLIQSIEALFRARELVLQLAFDVLLLRVHHPIRALRLESPAQFVTGLLFARENVFARAVGGGGG